MPIFIKQTNTTTPNYIKVKGKVYKRTGNTLNTFGTYVTGGTEGYDVLENADFKNVRKQDSIVRLRPLYACISTDIFTPATANTDTHTYNLIVMTKQPDHPLYGQGSTFCFAISGVHGVPLNLIRGKKYIFKQYNPTNTGHKATITADAQGINIISNMPDNNYSGTAGTDGVLTFILPLTCQDSLYLSSEGNQYMGIQINIDKFVESVPASFNNYQQLSAIDFFTPLSAI